MDDCNNKELKDRIDVLESECYGESVICEKVVDEVDDSEKKILGVSWDVSTDELIFSVGSLMKEAMMHNRVINKRYVLSILSKVYDPLGILSPITINIKLFFQDLCRTKISWDEELSEQLKVKRKGIIENLFKYCDIRLQRNYLHGELLSKVVAIELHGFSDASIKAYAAVCYFKIIFSDSHIVREIIASKTKVAPLKKVSIPRLELLACLILSRLMKVIISSICDFKLSNIFCWSDSIDCIFWINSIDKVWERFVQRRGKEIRGNLSGTKWQHYPGALNPADIPTSNIRTFNCLQRWQKGPEFLSEHQDKYPMQPQ